MITKITEKNTEFYTELFNEVTKNLQDFVKNHITSITTTSKEYTIPLTGNVIIAKGEEVQAVAVKPGTEYKYYQMGEEKSVPASDLNEIAKKLCQSYVDVGMGQVTDLEDYFGIIRTISEYIDSNYQILPLVVKI